MPSPPVWKIYPYDNTTPSISITSISSMTAILFITHLCNGDTAI